MALDEISVLNKKKFFWNLFLFLWGYIVAYIPIMVLSLVLEFLFPLVFNEIAEYYNEGKHWTKAHAFVFGIVDNLILCRMKGHFLYWFPFLDPKLCGAVAFLILLVVVRSIVVVFQDRIVAQACNKAQLLLFQSLTKDLYVHSFPERIIAVDAVQVSSMVRNSSDKLYAFVDQLFKAFIPRTLAAITVIVMLVFVCSPLGVGFLRVSLPLIFVIVVNAVFSGTVQKRRISYQNEERKARSLHRNCLQRLEMFQSFKAESFAYKQLDKAGESVENAYIPFQRIIHLVTASESTFLTLTFIWSFMLLCDALYQGILERQDLLLFCSLVFHLLDDLTQTLACKGYLVEALSIVFSIQPFLKEILFPVWDPPVLLKESKGSPFSHAAFEALPPPDSLSSIVGTGMASPSSSEMCSDFLLPSYPVESAVKLFPPCESLFLSPSVILDEEGNTDISVENLLFRYPLSPLDMSQDRGKPFISPFFISCKAKKHCLTAYYGPSGCGKSSILRVLCGLLQPAAGRIHTHAKTLLLDQSNSMEVGSIGKNLLLERCNEVHSNQDKQGRNDERESNSKEKKRHHSSDWSAEQKERVYSALKRAYCDDFVTDPFNTFIENTENPPFSKGQLQRLQLARVFAHEKYCTLFLFDEPTTGLDEVSATAVLKAIKELRDIGKTVIITTHDPRVRSMADTVVDFGRKL